MVATTQQAAERYYDRSSDCSFTSFRAYEYSNSTAFSKMHRNIIFRNEVVPELPISSQELSNPLRMLERPDQLCIDREGACEFAGSQWWRLCRSRVNQSARPGCGKYTAMMNCAILRKCCSTGAGAPAACEGGMGSGAIFGRGCQARLDFAHYAFIEGMAEQVRMGINPYLFGFAGSTDTHNASLGDVDEDQYDGCCANTDNTVADRLRLGKGFAGRPAANLSPGGLVGIWAEENSRDSLFDGRRWREVFTTSGTRITSRFFASWQLPENICDGDIAAVGYADGGVPRAQAVA